MHLEITLAEDRTETVDSALIDKLYNLSYEDTNLNIASQLDNSSTLAGKIEAQAAYEDAVTYLTSKYPNLHINIPNNNYYIRIQDSIIENSLVSNYSSDGIGVTATQLASILYLGNGSGLKPFNINDHPEIANITTFPEFKYFTGIVDYAYSIYAGGKDQPTGIVIDLIVMPRKVMNWNSNNIIKGARYDNHITINNIDWNGASISYTGSISNGQSPAAFSYIDISYYNGILPDLVEIPSLFHGNKILGKMIYPEGVISVDDTFNACNLDYIEFPTTLTDIYRLFYELRRDGDTRGGCMVFKSVTPPTFHPYTKGSTLTSARDSTGLKSKSRPISKIYVPDGSVNAYKTKWALDDPLLASIDNGDGTTIIDKICSMALMSSAELEKGTVTQADIYRT